MLLPSFVIYLNCCGNGCAIWPCKRMEQRRRAGAQACLVDKASAGTPAKPLFVHRGLCAKLIIRTGRAPSRCAPAFCLGTSSLYNYSCTTVVYGTRYLFIVYLSGMFWCHLLFHRHGYSGSSPSCAPDRKHLHRLVRTHISPWLGRTLRT